MQALAWEALLCEVGVIQRGTSGEFGVNSQSGVRLTISGVLVR